MNEAVDVFKVSEPQIKKIVLLETLGLIHSYGEFDSAEKNFINDFAKKIFLTDADVGKTTVAIKEYLDALKKVTEVIA